MISRYVVWIVVLTVLGLSTLGHAQTETQTSGGSRTVLKKVVPGYPPLARQVNAKGSVRIEAEVAADGTVKAVNVKGGHPILVDAAQTAIRQWKYAPADHATTELIEIRFSPS